MKLSTALLTTLTLATLLLAAPLACGAKDAPPAAAAAAETEPKVPPNPVTDGYEATRAALAADDLARAKQAAAGLAKAAGAEAMREGVKGKELIDTVSTQATRLAAADDIAAARLAFGEASKAFIGWVVAEPSVGEGLHAFMCPMAKGYKKWVEQGTKMANPYMGKSMLECGAATEMTP
ncbi:MAG: DUF3347 domain-containing protein [Deltaproteobacteria bacterium]|nr:DUF3347 domain-containing protein [Deltaproteobacteria bacterium]MCB9787517.1 DUF3347 domain-containing protein [Deltaproteobacteria bacterium]